MRKEYMNLEILDITGCKLHQYDFWTKSRIFFGTTILIGLLKNNYLKGEDPDKKQPFQLVDSS